MGRKSSSKEHNQSAVPPSVPPAALTKGKGWPIAAALVVGLIGISVVAFVVFGGHDSTATAGASTPPAAATDATTAHKDPDPSAIARNEAAAQALAAFGPHKQVKLPPVPFRGYAPPRPPEVVQAAFEFAAEHPEVLSYVPCFCGCQQMGHRGNEDCFVKSRAANGDVTQWEDHGVECAVCIDVATRSRQMYASGASVREIRAAIEKEFAHSSPTMTPTPKPPAASH